MESHFKFFSWNSALIAYVAVIFNNLEYIFYSDLQLRSAWYFFLLFIHFVFIHRVILLLLFMHLICPTLGIHVFEGVVLPDSACWENNRISQIGETMSHILCRLKDFKSRLGFCYGTGVIVY